MNDVGHLTGRYHFVELPLVGRTDIHKLDESQDDIGAAKMIGQMQNTVFVESASDHRIDLHAIEASCLRVFDTLQYAPNWKLDIIDALKRLLIQRIETDINPLETGSTQ